MDATEHRAWAQVGSHKVFLLPMAFLPAYASLSLSLLSISVSLPLFLTSFSFFPQSHSWHNILSTNLQETLR